MNSELHKFNIKVISFLKTLKSLMVPKLQVFKSCGSRQTASGISMAQSTNFSENRTVVQRLLYMYIVSDNFILH